MATINKKAREFIDLDFAFGRHPVTSNVSIRKGNNAVKQSILHLLKLKSGDKPFHPEIKSPIYDYLFENASMIVQIVLEGEIRKYINTFEPRVSISIVKVSFPDNNTIACNITGTMINVAEPFNINILIDRLR